MVKNLDIKSSLIVKRFFKGSEVSVPVAAVVRVPEVFGLITSDDILCKRVFKRCYVRL